MARPALATLIGSVPPLDIGGLAAQRERDGWDGISCIDSQNIGGDVYANLAMVAANTSRAEIGPWVTNPATRHPAVTASAIATIDELSGGRAVLGIGRGDSALAHLGSAPVGLRRLEDYVRTVHTYLGGRAVPFDQIAGDLPGVRPIEELPLGHAPAASTLVWRSRPRQVPIDIAATGPKVIALAALHADRVTIAVGADVERIRWAMEVAREARRAAGLDPSGLSFGGAMSIVPVADVARARSIAAGAVASQARFSVMHGTVSGPVREADRQVYEGIVKAYDMDLHGASGRQIEAITDEFVDRLAVVGPPARCVERLQELAELGLERIMLYVGNAGSSVEERETVYRDLVDHVLPSV